MMLVGRDRELAQLRDTCRQARDGRGRVVVISGEAGLGKSALVEAIASEVDLTFAVTWGRAWELADAPAYFPLWPCLKSLGVVFDGSGEASSTFDLWERVLEALVRAAAHRPVLWIVEDLHVADTQTLDLLCFLAQAVRPLPVVLVATTRPQDPRLDDAGAKRIVRLARGGVEIRLAPLDPQTVDELAKHWLGRDLAPGELEQLADRTGGNPLFVIECARAGSGHGRHLLEAVPPTVAVVVGERVDQLPDGARALLADAAILGNEVTAATLGAMTGLLPARVIDDLAPALRAGFLEELAPGRFRFSHALVRDAIEARMAGPDRSAGHARAEKALAASPDSPKVVVERARHALASIANGSEDHALELAERALQTLEEQGTYDRATALAMHVLELRAGGVLPAATPADLVRASSLARASGRHGESRELALEAASHARAAGDADALASAALAIGADVLPGRIDPVLVQHLEEVLPQLPPGRMHCRVSARLAAALQPAPDPQVPIMMARTAVAEARAAEDPELLEEVLFSAISTMTEFVDAAELRELNREHLALARDRDDVEHVLRAYTRLLFGEAELGDFAAFDTHLDEMMRIARAVGHPRLIWRALLMSSMRAIARGQFAESERYIAEVERAGQLTDDPMLAISLYAHKQARAVELQRETTVHNSMAEYEARVEQMPGRMFVLPVVKGTIAARFNDAAGAAAAMVMLPFDKLLERGGTTAQVTAVGEMCAAGGTMEQRKLLLERLLPVADRHIYFGHTPMIYSGPTRRAIGLLQIALGDRAAGEQQLRQALDTCRALGFATWVARLSYELGDMAEAGRLATNLGIRGLARRAAAPGSSEPLSPPTRPALGIAREGDIWRISYGVRVARVSDSRGMELIAKLVERPGEEMHVLVLAGTGGETLLDTDAGEALDERAARSYRDRIAAIDTEMETAKGDRAMQLRRERDFLQGELSRAFGLGNAARKVGSVSERARVNVQRRIKDSLTRIGAHDAVIADYLRGAIRTGTYCTFRP
jgi:hypothetical protein